MPLPETIPVKYTEEEAEYVSIRPVVRQTFRGAELIDMVLGVTGKDLPRIQQILRSGTIVFHSYRYWWPGFEAGSVALAEVLAGYPDSDHSRPFRAEACTEVILESSGSPARHSLRLRRNEADKKRILRARSFWDCLMALARGKRPAYREYSYAFRGDIYFVPLSPENIAHLASDAARFAPRSLRAQLATLASASQLVLVCPRR
ncbi:MAG: hypothetical protein WBP79_14420 [Candidatus Acidiferrales bacterium]